MTAPAIMPDLTGDCHIRYCKVFVANSAQSIAQCTMGTIYLTEQSPESTVTMGRDGPAKRADDLDWMEDLLWRAERDGGFTSRDLASAILDHLDKSSGH
jgi:hypothetical protein